MPCGPSGCGPRRAPAKKAPPKRRQAAAKKPQKKASGCGTSRGGCGIKAPKKAPVRRARGGRGCRDDGSSTDYSSDSSSYCSCTDCYDSESSYSSDDRCCCSSNRRGCR